MSTECFTRLQIHHFRAKLLSWFDASKRDLPWRRTRDPYAIWVSEVMLQQTRVAAVLEHYANWMRRFPTVEVLAGSAEEEILAAWSGLGYYRRARFLHRGAKAVVAEYAGKLPASALALRGLPGIGAYTSAAIASIAFGEPAAVVDGNVERVLLRQTGCSEAGAGGHEQTTLNAAEIQRLAASLIEPGRPGDFNQAMMELGATVCLPRNPLCLQCPVERSCRTRGEHPTMARKPGVNADIAYGLRQRTKDDRCEVFLEQRGPDATVMPGMWELPCVASDEGATPLMVLRHAIMQTNYRVRVIPVPDGPVLKDAVLDDGALPSPHGDDGGRWVTVETLPTLPLTGLARKILVRLGLFQRA